MQKIIDYKRKYGTPNNDIFAAVIAYLSILWILNPIYLFILYIYIIYIYMKKNIALVEILKKHTNIDTDFIDTFFGKFKTGKDSDFHIKDTDAAEYLGIKLSSLKD